MVFAKVLVMVMSLLVLRVAAETTIAKPEDVGLSSERLARITEMMKRHVAPVRSPAASRSSRGTAASPISKRSA